LLRSLELLIVWSSGGTTTRSIGGTHEDPMRMLKQGSEWQYYTDAPDTNMDFA
jgi:hypothetical protein